MSNKELHGIFPIVKSNERNNRKLDIIFIHGLGGDANSTWLYESEDNDVFWPNWLVQDFDSIGVWTIGYGATPSRWVEDEMSMEDRATNLLKHLSVIDGIGDQPVIFITHSMGGLIAKHIIEQAGIDSDYEELSKQIMGVVFIAVPHNGSGGADFLKAAKLIVRGNKVIDQLAKDDPSLRRLSNSFSKIVTKKDLSCISFFETKEVRVKKFILATKGIKVVSESSAKGDFSQPTPTPLDGDHISICKLKSRKDLLFLSIKQFIKAKLENTQKKSSSDTVPVKFQISKLPHTNSQLYGREDELKLLNSTWKDAKTNIITLKAMGGTGKTALMQKWLVNLAETDFQDAHFVYTWSFYSQGSAEDKQASADEFFNTTLKWFGYEDDIPLSAHDKGLELAKLIQKQRTLLLLDGLEPLQYPEAGAMSGALREVGLKTLFDQLAIRNKGLLVISSRQFIPELDQYSEPSVIKHKLKPLSITAGKKLFKAKNIKGTDQEFEDTVKEFNGHALSLNLLAEYLGKYEGSDIKQRENLITLTDFPEDTLDSCHAFTVMASYENQLKDTADLQLLYIMGLFDRPVSKGAIQHLQNAKIDFISDLLPKNKAYKAVVNRLRNQDLLNNENLDHPDTLDTHPLIREYFGKQLKQNHPEAWQQAHRLLYDYYKDLPEKQQPDTLEEMEPLFAAIAHGCAAGMHQQALADVYWSRILRENDHYIARKLGAFGSDLSALSHFFSQHWLAHTSHRINR